jgi:hypothetical protein
MKKPFGPWAVCAALLLLTGCTTIGHDHGVQALGSARELRLCGLFDEGITHEDAAALLHTAWGPESYGVTVRLVGGRPWLRPGFTANGIMEGLAREPRPEACDVLMAFIGRTAWDGLWALGFPEVLGAAVLGGDRAFVVAHRASLNQWLRSPASVLRHELLHVLGCEHGWSMLEACQLALTARR